MAGSLFYTEQGHVVPTACEELTSYRRARKLLRLPESAMGRAVLYALVRRYLAFENPLHISVNGYRFEYPVGEGQELLHWAQIPLPAGTTITGDNMIEIWVDSLSQSAWTLGLEGGHENPRSFLSIDGGRTWQNQRMGLHHVQRGEYVVRLRTKQPDRQPAPPPFVWEPTGNPRLAELRSLIPESISSISNDWHRARSLASWVSQLWPYANSNDQANLYTPWDPWTILAWNPEVRVHGHGEKSIRMCVHYAVFFTSACLACGIPARGVVCTSGIYGPGHFVSEVWNEGFSSWSMIDPSCDLVFLDAGRPLGVHEIYGHGPMLKALAQPGPGTEFQQGRLGSFMEEYLATGKFLRLTGIWYRNDFLASPDLTPPCHGKEDYCETGIIWRNHNVRGQEVDMFPYLAANDHFESAPPAEWLQQLRQTQSKPSEISH